VNSRSAPAGRMGDGGGGGGGETKGGGIGGGEGEGGGEEIRAPFLVFITEGFADMAGIRFEVRIIRG